MDDDLVLLHHNLSKDLGGITMGEIKMYMIHHPLGALTIKKVISHSYSTLSPSRAEKTLMSLMILTMRLIMVFRGHCCRGSNLHS